MVAVATECDFEKSNILVAIELEGEKAKALRWWTLRKTLVGGDSLPDRGCGTR